MKEFSERKKPLKEDAWNTQTYDIEDLGEATVTCMSMREHGGRVYG